MDPSPGDADKAKWRNRGLTGATTEVHMKGVVCTTKMPRITMKGTSRDTKLKGSSLGKYWRTNVPRRFII